MATKLTWLGHGSWLVKSGSTSILLDPFLNDSPTSPIKSADVSPDFILLSHGHFDHVSDVAEIANRTAAQIIAPYEASMWFQKEHDLKNTSEMNVGGGAEFPFGHLRMTNAIHSSCMPDGSYGGQPAGFVLTLSDGKIYFACDTALFSDMQQLATLEIDLAVLPIGDRFTMGPDDAVEAVKWIKPRRVAPAHYNTWPLIEQDASAWAERVERETPAKAIVVEPGQDFNL